MTEYDAEIPTEALQNPHARITDYHRGNNVKVNLTTLSRISSNIVPPDKISSGHNKPIYEISSSYEGGILGYISVEDLKKFLPKAFNELEKMTKGEKGENLAKACALENDKY